MKKIICFIVCFAILLTLAACGKADDMSRLPSNGNIQNTSVANKEGSEHIKKTLCDGLEIDADIPAYSFMSLPTYKSNPLVVSKDNAVKLFMKEKTREISVQKKDDYDPNGFCLTMKHGQEIYHQSGRINYYSETPEKDQEIFDVLWKYGEVHQQKEVNILSFKSPQEVIKQGEELLKELGAIGSPDIKAGRIVGLSASEIMNWQAELLKNDEYKKWTEIGKTIILKDLTAEDDAYLLDFSFKYQNVPVFNQDFEPAVKSASDGFSPPSMKAYMLVTQKGLRYFTFENGMSTNGVASSPRNIISAQQALNNIIDKYDNTILFGTQRITEVWLEYIPISDPDSHKAGAAVTLMPYWCFRVATFDDKTGKMLGKEYDSAERINAITGKDLTYGW